MKSPSTVFIALLICAMQLFPANKVSATQFDVAAPPGGGDFGGEVVVLPNGNFVVIDPYYTRYPATPNTAGRVCLYDGNTLTLINVMIGTADFDLIGDGGVTVLANGDYVVISHEWNHFLGAVTRCSATTGCPAFVSAENSLVGSIPHDHVGSSGVAALPDGNYVVRSVQWNSFRGAITWCDGNLGCAGEISAVNSRVGTSPSDRIGDSANMIMLANGNYVVESSFWHNGSASGAGVVTFCKGDEPCTGGVSIANSLVGTQANQHVGSTYATLPLTNGNYVVRTAFFAHGTRISAVTFCDGTSGCHESVRAANSLFGTANDGVGEGGVTVLTNGDYVVLSPSWDNGGTTNVGAATLCNGVTGCVGMRVSTSNSLVGMTMNDYVGNVPAIALANGKYVVNSPNWDDPATSKADVGASTFCSDPTSCIGTVSAKNSLVGTSPADHIGDSGVSLGNGNYVIASPEWSNTAPAASAAGAVTFCNGKTGCLGKVTSANSLIGSSSEDNVGMVTALTNGNYVVTASRWNNGTINDVGAATFCSGAAGCQGEVSAANSLIGSITNDSVGGFMPALALAGGNYVVMSPDWDNGAAIDAGALTTCNGLSGCIGTISSTNSLVGSTTNDRLGGTRTATYFYGETTALSNGDYVLRTFSWDNAGIYDAGAVTYGFGNGETVGPITRRNSVLGTMSQEGGSMSFSLDPVRNRLVVGRPEHHVVTVFIPDGAPEPISAVSRKVHGTAGTFDIDLLRSETECRSGGAGGNYQIVVTFSSPVSVAGVSVKSSDGNAMSTESVDGAVVTIDLSRVANAQTVMVRLLQVSDAEGAGDIVIPLKVLASDVWGDGWVDTYDVTQAAAVLGQTVNAANFRADVIANGSVNGTDIALIRSSLSTHLP